MNYCPNCGCKIGSGCAGACQKSLCPEGHRSVLVTTSHRGVFFGYAKDTTGETIALKRARLVVYWSAAMKGFLGLAAKGPDDGCRIGEAADVTLRNITCVVEVSDAATLKFEAAPWTK